MQLHKTHPRFFRTFTLLAAFLAAAPLVAGVDRWTALGPYSGSVTALAVDPRSPDTLYAGAQDFGVYKSTDGGAQWIASYRGIEGVRVIAFAFDPAVRSILYAGSQGRGAFKSTDRGATWIPASQGLPAGESADALAVDPRGSGVLYAGTGSGVFRSDDRAATWRPASAGLPRLPNRGARALLLDPADPDTVYAGVGSGVYKSTDRGASWAPAGAPLPGVRAVLALAVDPRPAGALYAGTTAGVFKSADRGASWQAAGEGLAGLAVPRLAVSPGGVLYAGTGFHGVFRSTDGGASWSSIRNGLTDLQVRALAVDPSREGIVYAGTAGIQAVGGVFKSVDRGERWVVRSRGLGSVRLVSLAVDPRNPEILYAGSDTLGVFKSTDRGRRWTAVNRGILDAPPPISISDLVIDPADSDTVYAVGGFNGNSYVFKTVNGGASWVRLADPAYQIFVLEIDPRTPTTLYGGGFMGLYKSTDGGLTWAKLTGDVARSWIYDVAVDPVSPSTVYAAGMLGAGTLDRQPALFKSLDGGATWTRLSNGLPAHTSDDILRPIAIDPTRPATLYAGLQDGLYKSTDGGATWRLMTSVVGDSGVSAIVIVPSSPDTLYMAAFDHGVFKSTDGGVTWTALDEGLPATYVFDLALSPAEPERLYVAVVGRGVFTFTEPAPGVCVPEPATLCLQGGRFRIEVFWEDFQGNTGVGQAVPLTGSNGAFWFFDPENLELTVKVLDGRGHNGHFWVFYGGLTNVEYTLTVTDTVTGQAKEYRNPAGTFASAGDTTTF